MNAEADVGGGRGRNVGIDNVGVSFGIVSTLAPLQMDLLDFCPEGPLPVIVKAGIGKWEASNVGS